MKRTQIISVLISLVAVSSVIVAQRLPSGANVVRHIAVLANDSLEGRFSGSRGGNKAAAYIERQFQELGLEPLGTPPSYLQTFSFLERLDAGSQNSLNLRIAKYPGAAFSGASQQVTFTHDLDYRVMSMSGNGTYNGEVVFVGYGISAPSTGYDDYTSTDVTGKAVMILRYTPEGDSPHGTFAAFSDLYNKVQKAKEHGAAAVLVVTGVSDETEDNLMRLQASRSQGRSTIPVVHMKRSTADKLLAPSRVTIDTLQAQINQSRKPSSMKLGHVSIRISTELKEVMTETSNVVGWLMGNDPSLRDEAIVIGAHYDHLGMGGRGSGSLAPDTTAIHNGADDNGSGTGALLELARSMSGRRKEFKRSILFIAFTGEELGLLGSAHYAQHPLVPLERTAVMLNMDMVGRMKERTVIVYGMGTAPGFDSLVQAMNSDSLVLKLNKDGFGPSDHSSFYAQKIPVMHFFTDLHSDYHRPSDDIETIRPEAVEPVLLLVDRIAVALANVATKPQYLVAEQARPQGQGRGFNVWVGTIPDYTEQSNGMKISGISANSPAEKAGLLAGDVMVKFGKVDVRNVYDYTYALGEYKPGDVVDIVVLRGTEKKTMPITLVRRNR